MTSTDPLAIVASFGRAWADHDLELALTFLTEDAVFESTGPAPDGVRATGKAQIRHAWQAIFDDADSVFTEEETIHAGDRVVQLWTYRWADGHIRGVDIFKVRDSLIAEKLSYVKG